MTPFGFSILSSAPPIRQYARLPIDMRRKMSGRIEVTKIPVGRFVRKKK